MAARRVHIDIETYRTRNPATIDRLTKLAIEKRPPGNASKADKAAWDLEQAISERIGEALSKTAINPMHAEILVICVKTDADGSVYDFDAISRGQARALGEFVEYMESTTDENTIWSAFNGKRFDFAVLLNRMIQKRIRPPRHFPVYAGGWRGRIFDTMERLPTYELFTSFAEACEAYGLECKTTLWKGEPMTGARVAEAYEAGDGDIIIEYCKADVMHEEQLYLAMTHGDEWGTFDAQTDVMTAIAEIADADMPPAHKWAAALPLLKAIKVI